MPHFSVWHGVCLYIGKDPRISRKKESEFFPKKNTFLEFSAKVITGFVDNYNNSTKRKESLEGTMKKSARIRKQKNRENRIRIDKHNKKMKDSFKWSPKVWCIEAIFSTI